MTDALINDEVYKSEDLNPSDVEEWDKSGIWSDIPSDDENDDIKSAKKSFIKNKFGCSNDKGDIITFKYNIIIIIISSVVALIFAIINAYYFSSGSTTTSPHIPLLMQNIYRDFHSNLMNGNIYLFRGIGSKVSSKDVENIKNLKYLPAPVKELITPIIEASINIKGETDMITGNKSTSRVNTVINNNNNNNNNSTNEFSYFSDSNFINKIMTLNSEITQNEVKETVQNHIDNIIKAIKSLEKHQIIVIIITLIYGLFLISDYCSKGRLIGYLNRIVSNNNNDNNTPKEVTPPFMIYQTSVVSNSSTASIIGQVDYDVDEYHNSLVGDARKSLDPLDNNDNNKGKNSQTAKSTTKKSKISK